VSFIDATGFRGIRIEQRSHQSAPVEAMAIAALSPSRAVASIDTTLPDELEV
jgi:hypothetical protein